MNQELRDGSGGCVRRQGVSACHSGEGFVKLARVKLPDTSIARADMSMSLKECEAECLRNCSCTAYTKADVTRGIGCLSWHGDLVDTRAYSNAGQDLYIRVDSAVLAQYSKKNGLIRNKRILAVLVVSVAVMFVLSVSLVYWLVMRNKKGRRESKNMFSVTRSSTYLQESPCRIGELDGSSRNSDLPFFDISIIVAATDNFSDANKLGEGGFGSVYKVWDLWREDKAMEIVDSSLGEQYGNEVSRCIQIGLLCVQEHATDRPTMSAVVFMLGNDTPLPHPKQPAFILKSTYKSKDRSISSVDEATITMIDAR